MGSLLSFLFRDQSSVNNLDSNTFNDMINDLKECVILDVRTLEENKQTRIPKSILIDFYKPDFTIKLEKLGKDKSYFVYCRSGNRSYHAAKKMLDMGFEKVYNLKNGIIKWTGNVEIG